MMETKPEGPKEGAKRKGTRGLLAKSVEIVTFIFAAFGHVLHDIAPPEEGDTPFAVGISSLLALCVLLYISAISKNLSRQKFKKRWLIAAGASLVMALIAAPLYQSNFLQYTFHFPSAHSAKTYFAGTTYTAEAAQYRQENPGKSIQEVLLDFGGLEARASVWTEDSIRSAKLRLTITYIAFVLGLAATIFCLTEGVLLRPHAG